MINYSDAFSIISKELKKIHFESEEINLLDSLGRITSKKIFSDIDFPNFDNSAYDGFAVKYNPAIQKWKINGEIKAGGFNNHIIKSDEECLRIMTGGCLPKNANIIIPLEDVDEVDGFIIYKKKSGLLKNQNIRFKGEDLKKGSLVLDKNTLIKSNMISSLASCGKDKIQVYKKLKIGVLVTGDELIDINKKPDGDKVRASNLYSLLSLIKNSNHIGINLGILKDTKQIIQKAIKKALESDVDILFTTGGVSVGKYDYVKDILKECGVKIYFDKVNVKPGKPLVFGVYEKNKKKKNVYSFPGNPVSSFVSFNVFFKDILDSNFFNYDRHIRAKCLDSLKKNDGKTHFVRGELSFDFKTNQIFVKKIGSQSSGNFSGLTNANCLIVFNEESRCIKESELVECIQI